MALHCTAFSPLCHRGLRPLLSSHRSFNLIKSSPSFLQIPESGGGLTKKPLHCSSLQRVYCLIGVAESESIQLTTSNPLASLHLSRASESIQNCGSYGFPHHLQSLVLADLDPATAKVAIGIIGPFLSGFGFLFILRIVMSWYPKLPVGKFPYVIAYAPTEPILSLTRKVIPPLGGVDVTPVVWFGLTSFLNEILVGPQGLLVLLSQQVS